MQWTYARLNMSYKKGENPCYDNYRDISIMAAIVKYMICNRHFKWLQPDREQACIQPKRGCIEHIVAL